MKLSEATKIKIILLRETCSHSVIAEKINAPKGSVSSVIRKYLIDGTITNKKHLGAPIKLKQKKLLRKIKLFILKDPNVTLKEIIQKFNLNLCRQTLSKKLSQMKILYFNMPSMPAFTQAMKQAR